MDIASMTQTGDDATIIQAVEMIGNDAVVLGSIPVTGKGTYRISFKPTGSSVQLWVLGAYDILLKPTCYTYPVTTQETYLVDICDENKDRYRFGFNGKEKDNELKGIGNSLDFGARMYDSRVSKFLSLDPDMSKYPFQSPYVYANNTPIMGKDVEGKGFEYYMLKMEAIRSKGTVAVSVSGGVHLGVGLSAAAGMAVDYLGNVGLFYSTNVGRDYSLTPDKFSDHLLSPGASITANITKMPGKTVGAITGKGESLAATFGANGLIATASANFAKGPSGRTEYFGYTLGAGIGTPGLSFGMQQGSTYAVLLSQSDYKTIADRNWDKEGIATMDKWQEGTDYGTSAKEGFWNYDGTEMNYQKVVGTKNQYEIVMIQRFHYNRAGTGKEKRKDVQTTKTINTGIIIEKVDNYTYESTNLKK